MTDQTVTFLFLLALALSVPLHLWLASRQIRHVASHREQVPAAFAAVVPLEAHQKAADYTIARQKLDLIELLWGTAVLVGWTLMGGLDVLNGAVRDALLPRWGAMGYQLGLFVAFSLIGSLLDIPFSLWRVFKLEQRFGFNRMTLGLWLRDQLMQGAVGLLIGLPLAAMVLWFMGSAGPLWWLWAFAAMALFMVLMMVVYPTVIAPMFNRFEPLPDGELKSRVEALMSRCGFRAKGFFVMDGSRRSAHANAYFTGFGSGKRVVFFDTLLKRLDVDEIEAVLAHELGHFHHRHVARRMGLMLGIWLLTLALIGWLMTQPAFYLGLGVWPSVEAPNHALALLLVMMVGPVFTFLASPIGASTSRRHEFQADAFASQHARADKLRSALLKLYEDNASTLTPDPLYVSFHYSHPPASARLAALAALNTSGHSVKGAA